jgi:hypothetical protein
MGLVSLVFALFTAGYILGVWTACLIFKQPQRAYEEGLPISHAIPRAMVPRAAPAERRL